MYSYHLLISSDSVRSITISVLYCAHLCMIFSLGVSNFLYEIYFFSCVLVSFLKWLSGDALQIAVKSGEAKSKGEKEIYKHLNAEFKE